MVDYLLIIDTEMYAGNFEREMCAWVTGCIGECEVGNEISEIALKDMSPELKEWCDLHVESRPGENGCLRPVSICATPGWFNTSGLHFRDDTDPQVVLEAHNKAVLDSASKRRGGYTRINDKVGARFLQEWVDRYYDKPAHNPAYLSVEIYLGDKPTKKLFLEMKQRVEFFCNGTPTEGSPESEHLPTKKIPLTCVRLVERKTIVTDLTIDPVD